MEATKTAMKIENAVVDLENKYNTDLDDEGSRYEFRDAIVSLIEPFVSQNDYYTIKVILDDNGVLWGPYQTFDELVKKDPRCSEAKPFDSKIFQKGLGEFPAAGLLFVFKNWRSSHLNRHRI